MSSRVRLTRLAAGDVAKARAWYEQQPPGLGTSFLEEIDAAIERIAAAPDAYPFVVGDARRILVRRFPYSIYFRSGTTLIRIIPVLHQRRAPTTWRDRVRQP